MTEPFVRSKACKAGRRTHQLNSSAHGATCGYQVVKQDDPLTLLDMANMHFYLITAILKIVSF